MELEQAIREVTERHAERICAPGKWRVYRKEDRVVAEIFDTAATGVLN